MQIFRDSAAGTARKLDERGIQRRHGEENDVGNINENVHEANLLHVLQHHCNLRHLIFAIHPHYSFQSFFFLVLQLEYHLM